MIINKLEMDLKRCTIAPTIDAVQGDVCSRILEIFLHSGGKPFQLPENLAVLIRYKKADGKGGDYDTLPDGSSAWSAEGNILTLTLAPQVLTFPGEVSMTVALIGDGKQLSTFPLRIFVHPSSQPLLADSEDYFRISGFLAAPGNAETGHYLQVSSVDASGRVTGISSAEIRIPAGGSGGAQSDWNAEEGEAGHILNRPFYSEYGVGFLMEETTLTASEITNGMAMLPMLLNLSDGDTYTVTYNGSTYSCIARNAFYNGANVCTLGNLSVVGGENTGEPFVIAAFSEEDAAVQGTCGLAVPLDGSVNFTLSITGQMELVHPIERKYLSNVRAQRKITLNLDDGTASTPVSQTAAMDTGELQSAISVIYQGVEHAAIITGRNQTEYAGMSYHTVDFQIGSSYRTDGLPNIYACVWDPGGVTVKGEYSLSSPIPTNSHDEPYMTAKLPSDTLPNWRKVTDIPLKGIVLKSTTANSAKTFLVTVDDTGTLSVIQR